MPFRRPNHLPVSLLVALMAWTLAAVAARPTVAQDARLRSSVDAALDGVMPRVVEWRRHIHANPELSNREYQTAAYVADHLRSLGIEVRTGIAHTGVVGVLEGDRSGPVVALRADMDALPVTERVDLPFASKVTAEYNGQEVGVMHACGHDNHVAILMGAAEVLAGMRDELPGTVVFLFQPAEEGAPAGEEGGADLMIEEGALSDPAPEAIFGLHVTPDAVGTLRWKAGGLLASSQGLRIVVRGRQTHGALPWGGVDPIVTSAQIIMGLQTVVSRQSDITRAPAVVTVGSIQGGVRGNIIPDSVVLVGTVRTLDPEMQEKVEERIHRTVRGIAESAGAEAEVSIGAGLPITYNDPDLTGRMGPTLEAAAGSNPVEEAVPWTGAEDFSYYQQEIPGFFFFLGGRPDSVPAENAPQNHSPYFQVDEAALPVGVRAMTYLAVDYLVGAGR